MPTSGREESQLKAENSEVGFEISAVTVCRQTSSQSDTELNTSTHLVMSLAEEKRDERQTFELEAKRVRNRRQVRSPTTMKTRDR